MQNQQKQRNPGASTQDQNPGEHHRTPSLSEGLLFFIL
jgi:hypothetical protein